MSLLDGFKRFPGRSRKDGPTKVVAITRVLDECDIIEAFVRHTARFASAHVLIDNGSRDGTLEILQRLKDEGFDLRVFQNRSVSFNEVSFNTFLFRDALSSRSADWVLCLDADEFIDDRRVEGGLLHAIAQLERSQPDIRGIDVPLTEYRRSRGDDPADILVPRRVRRRLAVGDNTKVFISGRIGTSRVAVDAGNHLVQVGSRRLECTRLPGLTLAHYAERSPYQAAAKWAKGWAKVLAAGPGLGGGGISNHYAEPFRLMRDEPERLFRDRQTFMPSPDNLDLADDPITYRGGDLRYTHPPDEPMRAIRMMMGYIEELAGRHGLLVHHSPEARHLVDTWNADVRLVIGEDASP